MEKLKLEDLGRIDLKSYKNTEKIPLILILDNVRSMFNVGSVFRTADAFLIEKIILCGITPQPPHRDIHKTALGATESVDWEYHKSTQAVVKQLKESAYKIYAIEQTDQSILLEELKIDKGEKIALVFGNEVEGISDEILPLLDAAVEIPQFGTKHSLNVSIAAGICIYEIAYPYIRNLSDGAD